MPLYRQAGGVTIVRLRVHRGKQEDVFFFKEERICSFSLLLVLELGLGKGGHERGGLVKGRALGRMVQEEEK